MEVATTVLEYMDEVSSIIKRGGPEASEYDFVKSIPKEMMGISVEKQLSVYELLSPLLTVDTMIGFTFQKPHGYAGDFELIDRIYSQWVTTDKDLYKWDLFYQNLEAAIAVRNRKKYFKGLVDNLDVKNKKGILLNLGSGPCVDLYEYLQSTNKYSMKFECLDMDYKAIEYGSAVCDNYLDNVIFINKNVFSFNPTHEYDLIWSAGLFDYFNDKIFVRLVRRIYQLIKSNGELVIGNFSTYNPSRRVMELYGQWYLHHRSEKTLIDLAIKAGVPKSMITVSQEDLGVNLFLHLKKT